MCIRDRYVPGADPSGIWTDADTVKGEIVNQAGRHVVSMHAWNWLTPIIADIAFVDGQSYCTLPTNFGEIIGLETTNRLTTTVQLTTLENLQYYRSSVLNDPYRYYVALSYPVQTSTSVHAGNPRLEIWPTPGADSSSGLKLMYRRKWTELTSDAAVPDIPLWMQELLTFSVGCFARKFTNNEYDAESVIRDSGSFKEAVKRDGRTQSNLGQMMGGSVVGPDYEVYRPYSSISTAG